MNSKDYNWFVFIYFTWMSLLSNSFNYWFSAGGNLGGTTKVEGVTSEWATSIYHWVLWFFFFCYLKVCPIFTILDLVIKGWHVNQTLHILSWRVFFHQSPFLTSWVHHMTLGTFHYFHGNVLGISWNSTCVYADGK